MEARSKQLKNFINSQVAEAISHVESAYDAIKYALENERTLHSSALNALHTYGISEAEFNKVRLSNVKKALLKISAKKPYKRETSHAVCEMSSSLFPSSEDFL